MNNPKVGTTVGYIFDESFTKVLNRSSAAANCLSAMVFDSVPCFVPLSEPVEAVVQKPSKSLYVQVSIS